MEGACKNLWSLSDEGRAAPPRIFSDATPFPAFPPVMRCYGWMRLPPEKLPPRFQWYRERERPRGYQAVGVHYAIVYEYVPDTEEQDPDVIQPQLDVFYLAGFSLVDEKLVNWRQGKLVDFCDLSALVDRKWWSLSRWKRRDARDPRNFLLW